MCNWRNSPPQNSTPVKPPPDSLRVKPAAPCLESTLLVQASPPRLVTAPTWLGSEARKSTDWFPSAIHMRHNKHFLVQTQHRILLRNGRRKGICLFSWYEKYRIILDYLQGFVPRKCLSVEKVGSSFCLRTICTILRASQPCSDVVLTDLQYLTRQVLK